MITSGGLLTGSVRLSIDGRECSVPAGITLAAALSNAGVVATRRSTGGEPRAAFCGMGVCHECAVLVNGQRRLACQTTCRDGLAVVTAGAAA